MAMVSLQIKKDSPTRPCDEALGFINELVCNEEYLKVLFKDKKNFKKGEVVTVVLYLSELATKDLD